MAPRLVGYVAGVSCGVNCAISARKIAMCGVSFAKPWTQSWDCGAWTRSVTWASAEFEHAAWHGSDLSAVRYVVPFREWLPVYLYATLALWWEGSWWAAALRSVYLPIAPQSTIRTRPCARHAVDSSGSTRGCWMLVVGGTALFVASGTVHYHTVWRVETPAAMCQQITGRCNVSAFYLELLYSIQKLGMHFAYNWVNVNDGLISEQVIEEELVNQTVAIFGVHRHLTTGPEYKLKLSWSRGLNPGLSWWRTQYPAMTFQFRFRDDCGVLGRMTVRLTAFRLSCRLADGYLGNPEEAAASSLSSWCAQVHVVTALKTPKSFAVILFYEHCCLRYIKLVFPSVFN